MYKDRALRESQEELESLRATHSTMQAHLLSLPTVQQLEEVVRHKEEDLRARHEAERDYVVEAGRAEFGQLEEQLRAA